MPRQNAVTRLEAVAAGLGLLADELQEIYGEPTPNLLYWRGEILEAIEELTGASVGVERRPVPKATSEEELEIDTEV